MYATANPVPVRIYGQPFLLLQTARPEGLVAMDPVVAVDEQMSHNFVGRAIILSQLSGPLNTKESEALYIALRANVWLDYLHAKISLSRPGYSPQNIIWGPVEIIDWESPGKAGYALSLIWGSPHGVALYHESISLEGNQP